jgi:hypothetical protein
MLSASDGDLVDKVQKVQHRLDSEELCGSVELVTSIRTNTDATARV